MINTGLEVVNAVLNNPMEAIVLGVGTYVAYKWFGDRRRRHYMWRDFTCTVRDAVRFSGRFIDNRFNSYCGLGVEDLDEAYRIIKQLDGVHNWEQRELLVLCLKKSESQIGQIIHALAQMKKIDWDENYCLVPVNHMKQNRNNNQEVII